MNNSVIVVSLLIGSILFFCWNTCVKSIKENYDNYHPQHSPINVSLFSNALKYPKSIQNEALRENIETLLSNEQYNDKIFNFRKNEPIYNIESIQQDMKAFNNASYTILTLYDNYLGNRV